MSEVEACCSVEGIEPDRFDPFSVDGLEVLELLIEYLTIDLLDIGGKDEDPVLTQPREEALTSLRDTTEDTILHSEILLV